MSFFNDNDLEIVRKTISNENAKKEQEARNRQFYAQMFSNTMVETFLLYKEAAKEYSNICSSLGIKPRAVKEEGFWGHKYDLYTLFCNSISDIGTIDSFEVGVTRNGYLVEFWCTNHFYNSSNCYYIFWGTLLYNKYC